MRNNEFLDNKRPEDEKIGELQTDETGRKFRMINGEKIYQTDNEDTNTVINRVRASGMSPSEYLKSLYHHN